MDITKKETKYYALAAAPAIPGQFLFYRPYESLPNNQFNTKFDQVSLRKVYDKCAGPHITTIKKHAEAKTGKSLVVLGVVRQIVTECEADPQPQIKNTTTEYLFETRVMDKYTIEILDTPEKIHYFEAPWEKP